MIALTVIKPIETAGADAAAGNNGIRPALRTHNPGRKINPIATITAGINATQLTSVLLDYGEAICNAAILPEPILILGDHLIHRKGKTHKI